MSRRLMAVVSSLVAAACLLGTAACGGGQQTTAFEPYYYGKDDQCWYVPEPGVEVLFVEEGEQPAVDDVETVVVDEDPCASDPEARSGKHKTAALPAAAAAAAKAAVSAQKRRQATRPAASAPPRPGAGPQQRATGKATSRPRSTKR